MGAGLGLVRVLHASGTNNANLVPADMTVNALLATAWDVSERFSTTGKGGFEERDIPVYNYESSNDKVE